MEGLACTENGKFLKNFGKLFFFSKIKKGKCAVIFSDLCMCVFLGLRSAALIREMVWLNVGCPLLCTFFLENFRRKNWALSEKKYDLPRLQNCTKSAEVHSCVSVWWTSTYSTFTHGPKEAIYIFFFLEKTNFWFIFVKKYFFLEMLPIVYMWMLYRKRKRTLKYKNTDENGQPTFRTTDLSVFGTYMCSENIHNCRSSSVQKIVVRKTSVHPVRIPQQRNSIRGRTGPALKGECSFPQKKKKFETFVVNFPWTERSGREGQWKRKM